MDVFKAVRWGTVKFRAEADRGIYSLVFPSPGHDYENMYYPIRALMHEENTFFYETHEYHEVKKIFKIFRKEIVKRDSKSVSLKGGLLDSEIIRTDASSGLMILYGNAQVERISADVDYNDLGIFIYNFEEITLL
ncbi:MAG: hypothetical protein ACP5MH_11335 [Thermoproteus sp.]